jgi:hypothetical protein
MPYGDRSIYVYISKHARATLVVIAYQLDLQLPMQSVPITTNVVRSNPAQVMCTRWNIM